ncbi:transforming growth factor-beta receptor-associated protein 1 [Chanos chanos]|uniref:Transforming growth factor-beta receptor-associated protein 1 n=1 Tax=Chanos chanos TaxID=29144 RepID=A0A6J2VXI2_CHACN|nr:transforming growth factor-beta receptor-associated protein 1-like [Chanos chanos]
MKAFTSTLVFEKPQVGKGKDKSTIQCLEWYYKNLYIGNKDGVIQHLILPDGGGGDSSSVREVGKRQLGRSGPVNQLKTISVLNHLLVLWDGSVSTLNMFSLEPVSALKKIQNVSLFYVNELCDQTQPVFAQLFTVSSKRRIVSIHRVFVDKWECVRQVSLPQDPVALAVDETCICVATNDRYLLHDYQSQSTLDIFLHNHGKQNIIAKKSGEGEFLLNGPGSLGMLVLRDGISQRPPVQWSTDVLDAAVYFPYVLALQSQAVQIYSILDQQLKQTIPVQSARGLLATPENVYVIAEREIHCLTPIALGDQIQALTGCERVDEALVLLDGVQALLPKDSYEDLYKNITCISGLIKFYREQFLEAKELFIKCGLDPREIICLYPTMSGICEDFKAQLSAVRNAKDLQTLSKEDKPTYQQYQKFLGDFLTEVRETTQGLCSCQIIDTALLKLYLEQEKSEELNLLVSSPNDCALNICVPDLEFHKRFFTLGLLYQSKGQHVNAIQTWVNIVEDDCADKTQSDVYQHIVNTLALLQHKDVIWQFADWVLQRDQEAGIQIFTKHTDENMFAPEEVFSFLTKYPTALVCYLEFLIYELKSQEEKHHTLLATTYVAQILQKENNVNRQGIRNKLQQLLWQSSLYNTREVHGQITSTALHMEKAILFGKTGQHKKALQTLVHEGKDQQATEDYCWRTSAGQDRKFTNTQFLNLLQIYLESSQHVSAAVDLLNNNAVAFDLVKVLQILPASWSLQLVTRFLCESLRETHHQRKMRRVEMNLAKVEHLRHKHTAMKVAQRLIKVDSGRICHSCQHPLTESEFLRSPVGELIHTQCYRKVNSPSVTY